MFHTYGQLLLYLTMSLIYLMVGVHLRVLPLALFFSSQQTSASHLSFMHCYARIALPRLVNVQDHAHELIRCTLIYKVAL